jgi:hypothetical protein
MGIYTSPAALMVAQKQRFAGVKLTQTSMHRLAVQGGQEDHRDYTGGSVKTRELRAMGHPFGRSGGQGTNTGGRGIVRNVGRFKGAGAQTVTSGYRSKSGQYLFKIKSQSAVSGRGKISPLPINRQTGLMQSSLVTTGPSGANQTYRVGFVAPYAKYVLSPYGTRKMVARGFYSKGNSVGGLGVIAKMHRARNRGLILAVRAAGRKQ